MPITESGQFQVNFVGDEANELFLNPYFLTMTLPTNGG